VAADVRAAGVSFGRPEVVLGIAALTTVVVGLSELPLVWDGSNFLFAALNEQTPLLIFHRTVESLLTAPVVAASFLTSDVRILRKIFSLSYAAVPTMALVLSWIVVRRTRPDLLIWPMLGIGLALLPGRGLSIAESLIVAQLSWPLFLAAIVSVERRIFVACLVVGAVVAVSHPSALVFLPIVGVIGWVERLRSGSVARSFGWLVAFFALASLNFALLSSRLDPYEVTVAQPIVVAYQLLAGAFGPQLSGLQLTALTALLVYRAGRDPTQAHRMYARAMVTAGLAVMPFLIWAALPQMWRDIIEYRAWAIPATLPLFAVAWLDARRADPLHETHVASRMTISAVVAAVMFVVLLAQGVTWVGLVARVERAVTSRAGCVPAESIEGFADTALGSWALVPLSLLVQGREVHAFVTFGFLCESARWPKEVPMMVNLPSLRPQWFRFE